MGREVDTATLKSCWAAVAQKQNNFEKTLIVVPDRGWRFPPPLNGKLERGMLGWKKDSR